MLCIAYVGFVHVSSIKEKIMISKQHLKLQAVMHLKKFHSGKLYFSVAHMHHIHFCIDSLYMTFYQNTRLCSLTNLTLNCPSWWARAMFEDQRLALFPVIPLYHFTTCVIHTV